MPTGILILISFFGLLLIGFAELRKILRFLKNVYIFGQSSGEKTNFRKKEGTSTNL
jgi:hypothetical protein